ncbi:unnamed protein product [Ectocarpus sp. CCAP 1310/34]|nr:unnamed protein product [Ectocarpus sp. CCAP 1310/34]
MARLARGRIRYEWYDECMQVLLLAVLCALAGEEDMFLEMAMFGLIAKLETCFLSTPENYTPRTTLPESQPPPAASRS